MPILILDGHSNASVETLQSLGRKGLEVDVSAEHVDCLGFHSRYASRKLRQPPQNKPEDFHAWLRKQHSERQYELIVPSTETALFGIRSLDPSDPIRALAVLPSNEAIDIALDKGETYELAHKLNVPTPQFVLLSGRQGLDLPAEYPVVVKPVRSKVTIGGKLRTVPAEVARNENEYRKMVQRWAPFTHLVRQEFIYGRGVGAEFLFDHGKKVWHFVHERVHELPLWGGGSTYRRSIKPPAALLADAERMLTTLGWHGVAMVEFRIDKNGRHWLMEINPRFWGSLALAVDAGVDFPVGLWHLARRTVPPQQPLYLTGYYTRNLKTDLEWIRDNLRAGQADKLQLTKPRLFSFIELLRPLIGRESWDHFDLHDLAVTGRILRSILAGQFQRFGRHLKRLIVKRPAVGPVSDPISPKELSRQPSAGPLH